MKFFSFTGTWNGYVWKRYILLLQIDPLFLSFDSAKLTYFTNNWFHWAFCTNGAYNFTHFFLKIILLIWKEEKGNHHCESKRFYESFHLSLIVEFYWFHQYFFEFFELHSKHHQPIQGIQYDCQVSDQEHLSKVDIFFVNSNYCLFRFILATLFFRILVIFCLFTFLKYAFCKARWAKWKFNVKKITQPKWRKNEKQSYQNM